MKYCPNCGAPLYGKFCTECSTNIEGMTPLDIASDNQSSLHDVQGNNASSQNAENGRNFCTKAVQYARNHAKQLGLIAAGILLFLILAVVLIANLTNIFRSSRVNNIDLGFTKEQVVKTLGEPNVEDDYTWVYYSKKYDKAVKKVEALETEIEMMLTYPAEGSLEEFLEKGMELDAKLEELEAKLETLKHDRIVIEFDGEERVVSTVLDKDCVVTLETETEETREVKKIRFLPDNLTMFSNPAQVNRAARIYYKGGDYRMEYIRFTNPDEIDTSQNGVCTVKFENEWGKCAAEIKISDTIMKNTVIHGMVGENITYSLTALETGKAHNMPSFDMTISGTGTLNGEAFREALDRFDSKIIRVTFTDGITKIEEDPFQNFTALSELFLNTTLTDVSESVLSNKALPDGPLYIGNTLLKYIGTVPKTFTIQDGTIAIAKGAFLSQRNVASIIVPASVTTVQAGAFEKCTADIYFTLSRKATQLEPGWDNSYYGNTRWGCENITTHPEWNFAVCEDKAYLTAYKGEATDVVIPSTIQQPVDDPAAPVSNSAEKAYTVVWFGGILAGNTTIKSVNICNGTTAVATGAFDQCSELTSVTVGDSVTLLGSDIFTGCSKLTYINIGDGVTTLPNEIFSNLSGLSEVHLGDGITSIPENQFYYRSNLKIVTLGNGITVIEKNAFSSCTNLVSLKLGNNLEKIGDYAFNGCSKLSSVNIPASVTEIGQSAFNDCSGLNAVHITDVAAWCKVDFNNKESNPLHFANHLYLDGTEVRNLVIPEGTESVKPYVFSGCESLLSVTVPSSLIKIGTAAFENCTGLTAVHISDLAAWCNISIPDEVTSPLAYAHRLYKDDVEVKELEFPAGITSVNAFVFLGCESLETVVIPNSVTRINRYAFYNCDSLTSVSIGSNVTGIGNGAFRDCSNLASITFADTSTWYFTSNEANWENKTGGTYKSVTSASSNATYFTSSYYYYWYKR